MNEQQQYRRMNASKNKPQIRKWQNKQCEK